MTINYYDPLPLAPRQPITPARRAHRRVRDEMGGGAKAVHTHTHTHTRVVLEPLLASASSTSCPRRPAYAILNILMKKPTKGITLFTAVPVMPWQEEEEDILVSCGPTVVIKCMPQRSNKRFATVSQCDDVMAEVGAMQLLSTPDKPHPHIVPLLDCLQDEDFIYLVMPHITGGDMFSRVEACGGEEGLPEDQARDYVRQVVEGLLHMKRSSGIAHHDLSLENIMITSQDDATIIDMGMCIQVPPSTKQQDGDNACAPSPCLLSPRPCCGKPSYVAPEVVREEACDPFAADMWSLGVCLYIMLTGRPLYSSPDDVSFKAMARGGVRQVMTAYERFGLQCSPFAKDLLCRMLHAKPSQRPTLEEILDHDFFFLPLSDSSEEEEEEVDPACCY